MTEENRNPQGTGAAEEGNTQTSTSSTDTTEGQGPKPGENESAKTESGSAVFGGESGKLFKTQEDAEKSYKESQKFIAKLQDDLKNKTQEPANVGVNKDLEREVQVLKNDLKMKDVFDDFATEYPDFKGKVRSQAREIIQTYVLAGKSIKMDEAYRQAKAVVGEVDDEDAEVNRSEKTRSAAGLSFDGGSTKQPRGKVYTPSQKDLQILEGLGLDDEAKKAVLQRVA